MPSGIVRTAVATLAGVALLAAAVPAEAGPERPRRTSSCVAPRSHHGPHAGAAGHRSSYSGHGVRSSRFKSHGGYRSYQRPSYRSYHRPSYRPSYKRSYDSYSPYRSYHRHSYTPRYRSGCGTSYGFKYVYPKYRYGGYRTYSSGVYLSWDGDVEVPGPVIIAFDDPPPEARVIDATYASPTEIGFELLGAGDYGRALAFFADASASDESDPMPRLGYALASAAQGSDDRAVWAMRRALQDGAQAIHAWPRDYDLDRLATALKDRYQAKADRYAHTPDKDALLMLAALNYLTDDAEAARAALNRAYPGGRDFYDAAAGGLAAGLDAVAPPAPETPAPEAAAATAPPSGGAGPGAGRRL